MTRSRYWEKEEALILFGNFIAISAFTACLQIKRDRDVFSVSKNPVLRVAFKYRKISRNQKNFRSRALSIPYPLLFFARCVNNRVNGFLNFNRFIKLYIAAWQELVRASKTSHASCRYLREKFIFCFLKHKMNFLWKVNVTFGIKFLPKH